MGEEDRPIHVRNEICDGYYGNVVQAGVIHDGVHFHQGMRDELSDLRNPVIVTVRREPGSTLADLAVDADPPRPMAPSGTLYVVTLEARTTRAVILDTARVVVTSRRPPRPACLQPRIGRAIVPRYFNTDLDAARPRLHAEGEDFPFSISATDVEQFRFQAVSTINEVCWQVELDWRCAGHEGTVIINDNGKPFEAYPVDALFTDDNSPSALSWDCSFIGPHQPGCPAHRFQSQPSPAAEAPALIATAGVDDLYRAALDLYAAMEETDPDEPASWPDYRKLATQVQTLLSRADFTSHESEHFRALLVRVVRYFYVSEQRRLGLNVARPVHRDWSAALGEEHPDTLAMANRLAGCLFGVGQAEQARDLWADILPRMGRTLGEAHPDTRTVAGNLAASLNALGDYEAARDLLKETLRVSAEALGQDHHVTLRAAGNLAISMHLLQDYEGARALQEDSLRRYRRTLGEDHPETLQEAVDLSFSLNALGEHDAARALNEDVWQRRRRVLGEDHPDTLAAEARCRGEWP